MHKTNYKNNLVTICFFRTTIILSLLFFTFSCNNKTTETKNNNPQTTSQGAAPRQQWHKGYGTNKGEHIHEVMETADGGFLGIGQTEDGEHSDLLVIKIDANGEFLWQRKIGIPNQFDVGICVDELVDGYLIGGGKHKDDQERYLAKLSFTGETLWSKTYDYPGQDMIRGIAIADNGDIMLTGYKGYSDAGFIFIADHCQGYIMRVNPTDGAMIWEKPLSTAQGAKIRKETGGFIICSTHWMNDETTPQDFYLIKLDESGNEIWAKNYGAESDEHCYDCWVASDGGYILGGHTRSPSYGVVNWDYLLMKIDSQGNEEWHETFGNPRGYDPKFIHDEAYGVRQTPDGGYVLVGGTGDEYFYSETGHSRGASDIWQVYLVKVNAEGKLLWDGIYGSATSNDAGEYLGLTSDGGFIIGTDSDEAGADKFEPNNFGFLKIK